MAFVKRLVLQSGSIRRISHTYQPRQTSAEKRNPKVTLQVHRAAAPWGQLHWDKLLSPAVRYEVSANLGKPERVLTVQRFIIHQTHIGHYPTVYSFSGRKFGVQRELLLTVTCSKATILAEGVWSGLHRIWRLCAVKHAVCAQVDLRKQTHGSFHVFPLCNGFGQKLPPRHQPCLELLTSCCHRASFSPHFRHPNSRGANPGNTHPQARTIW